MPNSFFSGIFETTISANLSISDFLLCIFTSLCIGLFLAFVYAFKSHYTKSFLLTLALLPSIVCVVIMMVNGNLGAGVAVAGAFSLVRFRSVPGTAKDIATIFLAMGTGLIAGMGYLGYAILFAFVLGVCMILFTLVSLSVGSGACADKTLRITIPEDLNYSEVFDDLFKKYTRRHEIISVKTSNLGSLYKLVYNITLKDIKKEKEFIDELRCRNGNLEICICRQEPNVYEL